MRPMTQRVAAKPNAHPRERLVPGVRRFALPAVWFAGMAAWLFRFPPHFPDAWPILEAGVSLGALALFFRAFSPKRAWAGLFPSIWWGASAIGASLWVPHHPGWVALSLYLALSAGMVRLVDGRWALAALIALWGAAAPVIPTVWVVALLGFLFPFPVKSHRIWFRAGCFIAVIGFGLLAWSRGNGFDLWDPAGQLWDFLIRRGYLAPALLAWLGAAMGRPRGWEVAWFAQLCGWIMAWTLLGEAGPLWLGPEIPGLLLLAGAGWGLETIRLDLMDRGKTATIFWWVLALTVGLAFRTP